MDLREIDNPAFQAAGLLFVGGLLGVLVGAFFAHRRMRWEWRMDSRRLAYLNLMRALDEFTHAAEDYAPEILAVVERGGSPAASAFQRRADDLMRATGVVNIFGTQRMFEKADEVDALAEDISTFLDDLSGNEATWDRLMDRSADLSEDVLEIARIELGLPGPRETRRARKDKPLPGE